MRCMAAATTLREARRRSELTLRDLARLAGTSHSTLSAYESGAKTPSTATFERIVAAAGFSLDRTLRPRVRSRDGIDRGAELEAVLDLAEEFPARHTPDLDGPIFGRR